MNDNNEQQPGTEVAQVMPWKNALIGARERFVAIADRDKIVEWQRESMFALQALEKSDYLTETANKNPASLRNAIINVAACGITLNPAAQYAALVPRDGAVCLDIMYRGLIKIATDAGSIRWAQAELVYSTDRFVYKGKIERPSHEANVFSKDRGDLIGVYSLAKTSDGDILVEVMSVDEVNEIRDRSSYFKKKKAGPWATDYGEMAKKTVIKRARKTWPESRSQMQAERLQTATELANLADGYDMEAINERPQGLITARQTCDDAWDAMGEDEQAFLNKIAIRMIGHLSAGQVDDAVDYLESQTLGVEEQLAIDSRFDSKQRTAMRKFRESRKSAA